LLQGFSEEERQSVGLGVNKRGGFGSWFAGGSQPSTVDIEDKSFEDLLTEFVSDLE
jgi:hypothetical protein